MAKQAREFAELLPDPQAKERLEEHASKLDREAATTEAEFLADALSDLKVAAP
jgi:hypothetical protein